MSNHYHLSCVSHGGESDDVGNRDPKPASLVMKNRENIVKAVELLKPLDIPVGDLGEAHWDSRVATAMRFVSEHPDCEIELHNESCDLIPFEDDPDPHDGPDKFCSKCGGRIITRSVPSGNGADFIVLAPACINIEIDRKKEQFVHWFTKGFNYPEVKDGAGVSELNSLKKFPGFDEGWCMALSRDRDAIDVKLMALSIYEQKD